MYKFFIFFYSILITLAFADSKYQLNSNCKTPNSTIECAINTLNACEYYENINFCKLVGIPNNFIFMERDDGNEFEEFKYYDKKEYWKYFYNMAKDYKIKELKNGVFEATRIIGAWKEELAPGTKIVHDEIIIKEYYKKENNVWKFLGFYTSSIKKSECSNPIDKAKINICHYYVDEGFYE